MTRPTAAAVLALALACSAGAAALFSSSEHVTSPRVSAALTIAVSLAFAMAGVVAAVRRPGNRTGLLMIGAGFSFYPGALSGSSNEFLFTVGTMLIAVPYVFVLALALGYPTGELTSRIDRGFVALGIVLAVPGQVGFMLVADPAQLCVDAGRCPENLLDVVDDPTWSGVVRWSLNAVIVTTVAAIIVRMVRRFEGGSPPVQRVLAPVYVTTAVAFAAVAMGLLLVDLTGEISEVATTVQVVALLLIPVAFLIGLLRSRLARGNLPGLLVALGDGLSLRDAIGEALGDPRVELAYKLEFVDRWVDTDGAAVDDPVPRSGRAVTRIGSAEAPVAAIVHDAGLVEERELLDAVTASFALALRGERRQAELRAQFRMLELRTDTAPSLLVNIATDGCILSQNRAAVAAVGLADGAAIRGRPFWDVFAEPAERDELRDRFLSSAPEFPAAEHEGAFMDASGRRRVILWRFAPLTTAEGRVESVIVGGVDVTERAQRELELQRERDATTTVLETIPSVIVILDRDGVIRDRDVDNPRAGVNRAFREALGWRDVEIVGTRFLDLVAEPDRAAAEAALRTAAAGYWADEVESHWQTSDGRFVPFAWTAAPVVDVTGRTEGLVLVSGMDITERRRQDEELRRSRARIVSAGDEARRRLERNLHDGAQQRLVALSVTLRLAEERLVGIDDGAVGELLGSARSELAIALEELRELARGIHPAVLTDRGLSPALEGLAARAPFPVQLVLPEGRLPQDVEAAVYYVVAEALTNVARYARASQAYVEVVDTADRVVAFVRDDGVGGADPATGSGLRGLADRVGALEGRVVVESPLGGGTVVHVEIPLRPPPDDRS